MTNPGMKCTRCRGPARHRMPSHNAKFCDGCLEVFFLRQVEKAIKAYAMLEPGQKVVVAISGGKDSLALWKVLDDLGYETIGLHLELELGDFSLPSRQAGQAMAQRLGRELHVYNFRELTGVTMDEVVWANRREFCSVCGTMKRHWLNRLTAELGAATLATGHHLDDETGRLLGNLIHGQQRHLEAMWPVLPAVPPGPGGGIGLVRKVKPLCRLMGNEIRAYAQAFDLPVAEGTCPRSKGATLPYFQEAMAFLEDKMPGTKLDFYLQFLGGKGEPPAAAPVEKACPSCGSPTFSDICTACRLVQRAREREAAKAEAEAAPAE